MIERAPLAARSESAGSSGKINAADTRTTEAPEILDLDRIAAM
jgi:hypothetical protein